MLPPDLGKVIPRFSPVLFVQLTVVGWTGDFLRRARPAAPGKPRPNIPFTSPNGNHNAGDLHFGKDGYLYTSAPTVGALPG